MRVEKIDIKKETIAIPDGQNYFDWIDRPDKKLNFCFDPKITLPESEGLKYKTYKIVEFIDDNRESRFFGVEQEKLFQDILNISNSQLNAIKGKYYSDGLKQGHNSGLMDGWKNSIKSIKKLSWFKRLFKLF